MGPPIDTGHHTYSSLRHPEKKRGGLVISFQGKKNKATDFQNICPCFKAAAGFGLQPGRGHWGGEVGGAQASRLRVLGPEAKGGKGQMGVSWAVGQDPSGDLGLFLNPFLPLLARASCQERRGK